MQCNMGGVSSHLFFSIIIPIYNTEKFLKECIESVLAQTFKDYEVLLVDDGSTDTSGAICDRYVAANDRLRVFHKENQGLLSARVYGISRASGSYIVSLDSDDMLRNDALALLYNIIKKNNADMVVFGASRDRDFSTRWNNLNLKPDVVLPKEKLYKLVCEGYELNNMVLKTFCREYAAKENEMLEYLSVKNGEDLLQSLEPITRSKRPVYLDETIYFYRKNAESITNNFQKDYYQSVKKVGMMCLEYAKIWDVNHGTNTVFQIKRYDKNLRECAVAIGYYLLNCGDQRMRKRLLNEIKQDDFFAVCYKCGRITNLRVYEQLLLRLLYENHITLLEFIRMIGLLRRKFKKIIRIHLITK